MPPSPTATNDLNDPKERLVSIISPAVAPAHIAEPSPTPTPKADQIGPPEEPYITAPSAQEAELTIEPAPASDTIPPDTASTMVYDEEKHMQLANSKDIDRVNPLQSTLPTLNEGERRSSVSPDRATEYCDPTRPASAGAAAFGMSQTRKYVLLSVFCMGVFIDGMCFLTAARAAFW